MERCRSQQSASTSRVCGLGHISKKLKTTADSRGGEGSYIFRLPALHRRMIAPSGPVEGI